MHWFNSFTQVGKYRLSFLPKWKVEANNFANNKKTLWLIIQLIIQIDLKSWNRSTSSNIVLYI